VASDLPERPRRGTRIVSKGAPSQALVPPRLGTAGTRHSGRLAPAPALAAQHAHSEALDLAPNNSMEPTRPARVGHFRAILALAGRAAHLEAVRRMATTFRQQQVESAYRATTQRSPALAPIGPPAHAYGGNPRHGHSMCFPIRPNAQPEPRPGSFRYSKPDCHHQAPPPAYLHPHASPRWRACHRRSFRRIYQVHRFPTRILDHPSPQVGRHRPHI